VLDHSWCSTAGPPTLGDAICSRTLLQGGYVALHALGGGVYGHSVPVGAPTVEVLQANVLREMVAKFRE
jgi:hypothetical protein